MKDWIKQILKETLDELSTKEKDPFGAGCYHRVYTSVKNPNMLYKVGDRDIVEGWVRIFKKYPDMFPKVYRVFPFKKNPNYWVVEIEKLDRDRAEKEFKELDDFVYNCELTYKGLVIRFSRIYLEGYLSTVINNIKTHGVEGLQKYIPLLEKWADYLDRLAKILEVENDYPDFHEGNFAYDSNNNIKAIDI